MNELHERIAALLARSPFPADLSISLVAVEPGCATVSMPLVPRLAQYAGLLHGGAVASILDTVAMMAFHSNLPAGKDVVTIDLSVHYLAAIRFPAPRSEPAGEPAAITATAREIHHGRTTCVAEAELFAPDGRLAAKGIFTGMIAPCRSRS